MDKKRVLIVDDSVMMRDMLQNTLERCGCTVCGLAKDGNEGINLFEKHNPDLVFMDINMPVLDGLTAVKNIKKLNPNAKIIMLSSMGDEEIIEQAKGLGVSIFLKKPFDTHSIISALSTIL